GLGAAAGTTVLARGVRALLEVLDGLRGQREPEGSGETRLAARTGDVGHEEYLLFACGESSLAAADSATDSTAVLGPGPRPTALVTGRAMWGRSRAGAGSLRARPRRLAEDAAQRLDAAAGDLLVAVGGGRVVLGAHEVIGRVLLGDHAVRGVVRVAVALAVTEALRAGVVGVAQVGGHALSAPGAHVGDRGIQRLVGGVGLRGGGDVDHGLGERDPTLGHAEHLHGLHRGDRDLEGGGIGHPHLLARGDDDAAGDESRVLPRLDHAGEIVQGGVHIAAPHRLDEGAGHVVVLVSGAVVADR